MSNSDLGNCPECDGELVEHIPKELEDISCSCHISPPCSKCVSIGRYGLCKKCDDIIDFMDIGWNKPKSKPSRGISDRYIRKTRTIDDLEDGVFGYISEPKYARTDYVGKYPKGMTADELLDKFNTCFGYRGFSMKDGRFRLTVHTD